MEKYAQRARYYSAHGAQSRLPKSAATRREDDKQKCFSELTQQRRVCFTMVARDTPQMFEVSAATA